MGARELQDFSNLPPRERQAPTVAALATTFASELARYARWRDAIYRETPARGFRKKIVNDAARDAMVAWFSHLHAALETDSYFARGIDALAARREEFDELKVHGYARPFDVARIFNRHTRLAAFAAALPHDATLVDLYRTLPDPPLRLSLLELAAAHAWTPRLDAFLRLLLAHVMMLDQAYDDAFRRRLADRAVLFDALVCGKPTREQLAAALAPLSAEAVGRRDAFDAASAGWRPDDQAHARIDYNLEVQLLEPTAGRALFDTIAFVTGRMTVKDGAALLDRLTKAEFEPAYLWDGLPT